jgi:hypothetical protein
MNTVNTRYNVPMGGERGRVPVTSYACYNRVKGYSRKCTIRYADSKKKKKKVKLSL